jgi:biotin transport system substrate-specific component
MLFYLKRKQYRLSRRRKIMTEQTAVQNKISRSKTYDMVYIAVFAVLMAICSWISIPTTVPFTLQTFGVFLAVGVLGGKRGSMAVLVYILLGAVGVPVFAGFAGGLGVLLGKTGGYIVGFIASALLMWGMEKLLGRKTWVLGLSMVLGLVVCYIIGTAWFMVVYARNAGAVGLATVLGWCVIPFIIPDLIKIALALVLSKRLAKVIKLD